MNEVEIKASYQLKDKEVLINYLHENGYQYSSTEMQTDVYFYHPQRNFVQTDEALRIRTIENKETKQSISVLTYKGKNQVAEGQCREELECEIQSMQTVALVLERLGFRSVEKVIKERIIYMKDDISFCLDKVKGLGEYLEIEIVCSNKEEAMERLMNIFKELKFVQPKIENKTYLDLLLNL